MINGVFMLGLGLFFEVGMRPSPVVPIGNALGFLLLCIGGAVLAAGLDRYFPKFGTLIYLLPLIGIFIQQTSLHTSSLPLFTYAGVFYLLRALLRSPLLDL